MSGPIPPKEDRLVPAAGSRLDPTLGSMGVEQATQEARSDVISVIAEHLQIEVGHVLVERAPPVREENGVTIIPVMEEVIVTETRLMLKEELHVRRVAETREHQQTGLLRRQRAEVERLSATGKPMSNVETSTSIKEA